MLPDMAQTVRKLATVVREREAEITPIADDPDYAEADTLLSALRSKHAEISTLIETLELEQWLGPRPADPRSESDRQLRWRLRKLRAALSISAVLPQPIAATAAGGPDLQAALQLLRGEKVAPAPSVPEQIEAAKRDLAVLDIAIHAQAEVVETIRAAKALEVSHRIAPRNDALLVKRYRVMQALAAVERELCELHARFIECGYGPHPRSDITPFPAVRASLVLGTEDTWNSEISMHRRYLEGRGIL